MQAIKRKQNVRKYLTLLAQYVAQPAKACSPFTLLMLMMQQPASLPGGYVAVRETRSHTLHTNAIQCNANKKTNKHTNADKHTYTHTYSHIQRTSLAQVWDSCVHGLKHTLDISCKVELEVLERAGLRAHRAALEHASAVGLGVCVCVCVCVCVRNSGQPKLVVRI